MAFFFVPDSAVAANCGLTRACSSTTYCSSPLSVFNNGTCLARRTSTQSCTGLGQGTCISGLVCDVRGECRNVPSGTGEYCGTGVSCNSSNYCSSPVAGRCVSRGVAGDSCTGLGQGTCSSNLVCDVSGECRHNPPIEDEPCGVGVSCASTDPNTGEPLVCPAVVGGRCHPEGGSGDSCIGLGQGTCEQDLVCDVRGLCRSDPPELNEPCGAGVQCALGTGLGCSSAVGGFCVPQDIDADGFPQDCGGLNEDPCTLDDQIRLNITSCKAKLEENIALGLCIDDCGGHGLPACVTGCDAGLSLQVADSIDAVVVCGAPPVNYGETDAHEAAPRGPRVVFFIHGRGSSISGFNNDPLLNELRFGAPNVQKLYGVDWNATTGPILELEERRVQISSLEGPSTAPEWELVGSYGRREFTSNSLQITEIAQSIAQSIQDLNITTPITIVTHSYGAVIARQLVYRHYDELRADGHRIVEVMTIKGPHLGGLVGTEDLMAPNDFGVMRSGFDYQTDFACNLRSPGAVFGFGGQDGCQLGLWVKWANGKGIDNTVYPQIRWIAVAGGGLRIRKDAIDSVLGLGVLVESGFRAILEDQMDSTHEPFLDSDGVVATRSALGIALDACYPYVQETPPNQPGQTRATVELDPDPLNEVEPLSATCYHAAAPEPPSPSERESSDHGFSYAGDPDDPDTRYNLSAESAFAFASIAVPEPGLTAGLAGGLVLLFGLKGRRGLRTNSRRF